MHIALHNIFGRQVTDLINGEIFLFNYNIPIRVVTFKLVELIKLRVVLMSKIFGNSESLNKVRL
jgi:hypothetical protein